MFNCFTVSRTLKSIFTNNWPLWYMHWACRQSGWTYIWGLRVYGPRESIPAPKDDIVVDTHKWKVYICL